MNIDEVLKALELIKKTCEEQAGCDTCPFGNTDGGCKINEENPSNWDIPQKQIIRLLV